MSAPTRRMRLPCCARTDSGHAAAAPPSSVRASRRCSGRDAIFIAPPAQNRTGGFPAYGLYGAFFVKGASRHFCRALLLHSFVRPAPRAFFHPDRTLPSPSRAAAVTEALLQRRRRLVLDGREHGGRLPVIGWSAAR